MSYELRICYQCKHASVTACKLKYDLTNLVDGTNYFLLETARRIPALCGPEGRFFEPKLEEK